jgi:Siphovirus Gp157
MSTQPLTLYEVSTELHELLDLREELVAAGESPVPCDDLIAEYAQREVAKVDSLARFIRMCEHSAETAAQESKRLATAATRWANRAERVKTAVLWALIKLKKPSVESPTNRLRRQKNPPSVQVLDPSLVPAEHVLLNVKITAAEWHRLKNEHQAQGRVGAAADFDLAGIKALLQSGVQVRGCKLVTEREHLRVE